MSIQLFDNGEFAIQITPDGDSFAVHAPGLARSLGYRDARDMARRLPEDEKGTHIVRTPGGDQLILTVTEPGLYRVLASRRPGSVKDSAVRKQVERFQRWLFHDVLPSLRRTGQYQVPVARQGEFFEPNTLTWEEAGALIRQQYGISVTVNEITRMLRAAGVLKQTGAPRKQHEHLFWFTGSAWNIHPHTLPQVAQHLVTVGRELQEFRFIQARLQLEGVGRDLVENWSAA